MPGEFLSRIHNHPTTCSALCVHVCIYMCVLFYFILYLAIFPSFSMAGFGSVISLRSDKAMISSVKKSHNRSDFFFFLLVWR